jgi:hypothetical protein
MIEPLLLTTARVSTFAGKGLLTCLSGFSSNAGADYSS